MIHNDKRPGPRILRYNAHFITVSLIWIRLTDNVIRIEIHCVRMEERKEKGKKNPIFIFVLRDNSINYVSESIFNYLEKKKKVMEGFSTMKLFRLSIGKLFFRFNDSISVKMEIVMPENETDLLSIPSKSMCSVHFSLFFFSILAIKEKEKLNERAREKTKLVSNEIPAKIYLF